MTDKIIEHNLADLYAAQEKELKVAGFTQTRKNIKLLKRAQGNVDLVKNFLEAKRLRKHKYTSTVTQKKSWNAKLYVISLLNFFLLLRYFCRPSLNERS